MSEYLKKKQSKDGEWEGELLQSNADMEGGETALVTLSLLEAGMPVDDPTITKAMDYLLKLTPEKTYVVSLQTQVLTRANTKKHKEQIQRNVDWLLKTSLRKSDKLEGWSYLGNLTADGSNTHFAVMGLHAGSQAGAIVNEKIWKQIEDLYIRTRKVNEKGSER